MHRRLRFLLIFAAGLTVAWMAVAFGQELKSGTAPGAITTDPLGMSGWASAPIVVTTQQLGMTGWRSEPVVATTPELGMTGWRSEPIAAETPPLGMTGWRSEPILLTAQPLGMTGWRRERDAAPLPAIVCLGGQVKNVAVRGRTPKYVCSCPTGRSAQAMASNYKNTFQCIPDTVTKSPPTPPKLACIGGAVRSGKCVCGKGFNVTKTGPNAYQCTRVATLPPPPKLVCTGGRVRNNACVCQAGFAPVRTGATSYRCQRVAVLPPPIVIPRAAEPTRTFQPTRVPSQPATRRTTTPQRVR